MILDQPILSGVMLPTITTTKFLEPLDGWCGEMIAFHDQVELML